MKEVVVGVDESQGAAEALRWAAREAGLHDWRLTAVMAWGFLDQHHTIVSQGFDLDYGEDQALEALDQIVVGALGADAAGTVGRRVECELAATALLDASAGAELLVVGARGLGGFRGLLLGSVSQHLLHHSTVPIAIVRKGARGAGAGGRTERIVVGVDSSPAARRALRWAVEEARVRHAALDVIHAWFPTYVGAYPYAAMSVDPSIYEQAADSTLADVVASVDTSGLEVPFRPRAVHGVPAAAILDAAEGADLVVMGSRGMGGFRAAVLGSVTNHVSRHAACPVVVVPPS